MMVSLEKMEKKDHRVKMLEKTKNCCQFHPNANAWPNLVQLVPKDPKAAMDHLEMPGNLAPMVNLVHKVHLVQQAPLAAMATMVLLAHLESPVV
jgi:hypothetical protein